MEDKFNSMQSQIHVLISSVAGMDQSAKNEVARRLFESGLYKPTSK
jgi:hypothetical protein